MKCYDYGEVKGMYSKKPPFDITTGILEQVAVIAELVGHVNATAGLSANPMLRRTNRIRSIYSSLAIEQNTLNLDQVTAVVNGKRVLAPPKDIAEVKNAYEIYEMLDTLDPYSMDDLLDAHAVMTRGLVTESGCFRSRPVGVVDGQGNILHLGSLPDYIPGLMQELLTWTRDSDCHMLIKSCVFHYELELIHPFADGNGRIGRLWHTLLLTQWKPIFAWLPVESIIHDRQEEYYRDINTSNLMAESTCFIEFMLSAIRQALEEAIQTAEAPENPQQLRWHRIEQYLHHHDSITNQDVCSILQVSASTANRILSALAGEGKLLKFRKGKNWAYRLP